MNSTQSNLQEETKDHIHQRETETTYTINEHQLNRGKDITFMDSRIVTKEDTEEGVVFSQTGRSTPRKEDSPVFKRDHLASPATKCFEASLSKNDELNIDKRVELRERTSSFADKAKLQ